MVHSEVVISGTVQGVFFRRFVYENAVQLHIVGQVWNQADGTLAATFEGNKKKVKELIKRCHQGPPDAVVDSVQVIQETEINQRNFSHFEVRHSQK